MRIDNITDQIELFSYEVAKAVKSIKEDYDVSEETALKIVQLGIESMKTEVEHHKEAALQDLTSILGEFEADIADIVTILEMKEGIERH